MIHKGELVYNLDCFLAFCLAGLAHRERERERERERDRKRASDGCIRRMERREIKNRENE